MRAVTSDLNKGCMKSLQSLSPKPSVSVIQDSMEKPQDGSSYPCPKEPCLASAHAVRY